MSQINPYLSFNGKCREAMTFYQQCLGGELTLQAIKDTPMEAQCPDGMKEQIMHSTLVKGDMLLMASDMIGPEGFVKGNDIALSVNCNSEDEIKTYFAKLSQDGKIIDPLKEQFWGATFGVLTDKYGVRWMFNYDKMLVKQNGKSSHTLQA